MTDTAVDMSSQVTPAVDPGVATGVLLRKFADSSLGEMDTDEVYDLATSVAVNPAAMGSLMGLTPEESMTLRPDGVRDRIMRSYFSQRFAQDMAMTLDQIVDETEADSAARLSRYAAVAGATREQMDMALGNAESGDCSAMNRIEETYFFG